MIVLVGCIAYLFWQNITLKREIEEIRSDIEYLDSDIGNIKSDIGTGSYDYPQLSYYRGGIVDWLSVLEYRIANLDGKYFRRN